MSAWKDYKFKLSFFAAVFGSYLILSYCDLFFVYIQHRKGFVFKDVVLEMLPSTDVSYLTFFILWGQTIYAIFAIRCRPWTVTHVFWAVNLETSLRFLCIYLVPLDPPRGLINLVDPVAEMLIYGEGATVTKDLFFSGHTATMCLSCFFLPSPSERWVATVLTFILAFLLLLQHVHYTIDVVAAPFFTLASIYITRALVRTDL